MGGAVGVAGDLGVLGLPQPSSVFRVMRLGFGLAFWTCGVCLSSSTAQTASFSFSCVTGEGVGRGTGEAVRPLPGVLLFLFSTALTGVIISSCGGSLSGVPSSSSSKETKEQ